MNFQAKMRLVETMMTEHGVRGLNAAYLLKKKLQ
jgi:hypothetical protein